MPKFTILNIIASTSTDWISTVLILLLGIAAILAIQRLGKVSIAQHDPPTLLVGWPLVGCADFFHRRAEFLVTGCGLSQDGHFCFRYGMHLIVALSGADGRASFFSTRGLDPSAGFVVLHVTLSQHTKQLIDTRLCSPVFQVRIIWKAGE